MKCKICSKANYQTSTNKTIFDAYCISRRGETRYFTQVKKQSEKGVINRLTAKANRERLIRERQFSSRLFFA